MYMLAFCSDYTGSEFILKPQFINYYTTVTKVTQLDLAGSLLVNQGKLLALLEGEQQGLTYLLDQVSLDVYHSKVQPIIAMQVSEPYFSIRDLLLIQNSQLADFLQQSSVITTRQHANSLVEVFEGALRVPVAA